MNFYWFMQVQYFSPEIFFTWRKKVAECHYGALLQHNMYISGTYPTHRVRVRPAEETFRRVPHCTKLNGTAQWKLGKRVCERKKVQQYESKTGTNIRTNAGNYFSCSCGWVNLHVGAVFAQDFSCGPSHQRQSNVKTVPGRTHSSLSN